MRKVAAVLVALLVVSGVLIRPKPKPRRWWE